MLKKGGKTFTHSRESIAPMTSQGRYIDTTPHSTEPNDSPPLVPLGSTHALLNGANGEVSP